LASWHNHVKANLKAGKPQIGTWMTLPGVHYCNRLAMVGFDWIMVDTEHSPTGNQGMAEAVATLSRTSAVPFVRVPCGTLEDIKRAYDCGAWGVLSPMVNSRAEAEHIVSWSKYPPLGVRSAGAYGPDFFGVDMVSYVAQANDQLMVMVQIESVEGIAHADEIISTPGLDCLFIGPGDLSISLGIGVQSDNTHPLYLEATQKVLDACARYGVAAGVMVADATGANRALERGFKFISIAADVSLIQRLFAEELGKVKR
jgi:4-hydroxy-2-oxoheptanedioate aldolase